MGADCCKESARDGKLQENLVRGQTRDFHEVYDVVELIGEGSISVISKIQKKKSAIGGSANLSPQYNSGATDESNTVEGALYALKEIDLAHVKKSYLEEIENEINLLKKIDHPNIIRAYETFMLKKRMAIVMELCTGGDLHTRDPYSEKQAATIVGQLLSAIAYLHERKIIHRDIKYENIMFESTSSDAQVKLIDFGLAKKYLQKDDILTERVGTLYTMSPQVLQHVYTSKADLWSIGVVTYMLLTGYRPFWGDSPKQIVHEIMKAKPRYDGLNWLPITREGKEFVKALLEMDPDLRVSAPQAIRHKWLSKHMKHSDSISPQDLVGNVKSSLQNYADGGDFKKLALNVIAKKSSNTQIMELRKVFQKFDTSRNGTVSFTEFKKGLGMADFSETEIRNIFNKLDINKNGVIMYTEFLAASLEALGAIEERRIAEAFDQLDSDDTGFISRENLKSLLGVDASDENLGHLISELDSAGDGVISYEEFKKAFSEEQNARVKSIYQETATPADEQETQLLDVDTYIPGGKVDSYRDRTASERKRTG